MKSSILSFSALEISEEGIEASKETAVEEQESIPINFALASLPSEVHRYEDKGVE
jgi:hypothetical protein